MTSLLLDDPQLIHQPDDSVPVELSMELDCLQIISQEDAERAGVFLNHIQQRKKEISEKFLEPVKKAHEAHKALTIWRAECLKPLEEAESQIKRKIGTWHQEQEKLRIEEERRLQKEADERAAAEKKRIEEEARAQAAKLEQEGRKEEAEALRTEAPIIAQQIVETAAPVALPKTKISGVGMTDNWKAEVTDMKALIAACAQDERMIPYLLPNMELLNKMAKSLKGAMKIPGVRSYNDPVVKGGRR